MDRVGIDTSHFQGDPPWVDLARAGIAFAIVKATHGRYIVDSTFRRSWRQLRAISTVPQGAYFWLRPLEDPAAQVDAALAAIADADGWSTSSYVYSKADVRLSIDFEDPEFQKLGARGALTAIETAVQRAFAATERWPILYTGRWFWLQYVGNLDSEICARCPLWHAQYPSKWRGLPTDYVDAIRALPAHPDLASPWANRGISEAIWQFDGDGGLTMPNGVDADFNRSTDDKLATLHDPSAERTPYYPSGPAHPIGQADRAEMEAEG